MPPCSYRRSGFLLSNNYDIVCSGDHMTSSSKLPGEQISNSQISNSQISNSQMSNSQMSNNQMSNSQISNTRISNERLSRDRIPPEPSNSLPFVGKDMEMKVHAVSTPVSDNISNNGVDRGITKRASRYSK